jgi:hypothetical protein
MRAISKPEQSAYLWRRGAEGAKRRSIARPVVVARDDLELIEGRRSLVEVSKPARDGRFDYFLVESTGLSEPLPVAEPRLGRRTVLTFPLLPPPQKN